MQNLVIDIVPKKSTVVSPKSFVSKQAKPLIFGPKLLSSLERKQRFVENSLDFYNYTFQIKKSLQFTPVSLIFLPFNLVCWYLSEINCPIIINSTQLTKSNPQFSVSHLLFVTYKLLILPSSFQAECVQLSGTFY